MQKKNYKLLLGRNQRPDVFNVISKANHFSHLMEVEIANLGILEGES